MNSVQVLRTVLLTAVAALLAACTNKPPGCADPETVVTAKQMLVDAAKEAVGKRAAEDDPEGWLPKFYDGLKVEFVGVVSEGYREDTKKQSCKGTLKFATVAGNTAERSTDYSTQLTVDQKSRFLLEVQDFAPFAISVGQSAHEYYTSHRWAGTWNGTYSCSGIDGAVSGPRGPISTPVSMVVTGTAAKLERVTQGGGIEIFGGDFTPTTRGQPFTLVGSGKNTPDDLWETQLTGTLEGKRLRASGEVRPAYQGGSSLVLRQCQLDVTLGAPLLQQGNDRPVAATPSNSQIAVSTVAATVASVAPATTTQSAEALKPVTVTTPTPTPSAAHAPVQTTAASRQPSLCVAGEEVVFSCAAGKKVVSLCSKGLTSTDGAMYYRIGVEGKAPEMTYPDSAVPARQAFKIGNNTYVGGDATFLTFQKGEFRYVVFSGSGKGWTKEGVVVQKAGRQIADLRCNGSADTVLQTSDAPSKGFAADSTPFELP